MSRVGASRLMLVLFLGLFIALGASCSGEKSQEEKPAEANETYKKTVNVVCSNNFTDILMEIPFEIKITAEEKALEGVAQEYTVTAKGIFPKELLSQAAQMFHDPNNMAPMTEIILEGLKVTITVRSGAASDPIVLGSSLSLPVSIPVTVTDDRVACFDAGFSEPCVLEGMEMQFTSAKVILTPDSAGTNILVGIDDSQEQPPQFSPANPLEPIPDPLGPTGFRVKIMVIYLGLGCTMGNLNDKGTSDPSDDSVERLADDALLAIPVI